MERLVLIYAEPKILEKEVKKEKKEVLVFPVDASAALRIALEDSDTDYFISTYFSHPAQNPDIISRKEMSKGDKDFLWTVEVIEKIPPFDGCMEMMNVARIEVDPYCGRIFSRRFFRSILHDEYQKIVKKAPP